MNHFCLINENKIYLNNGNDYACYFSKDVGPFFANSININNDFNSMQCVRTKNTMNISWINTSSDYELNDNKKFFYIQEIEVFEVLFI